MTEHTDTSRRFTRLEPLPDPFALSVEDTTSSRLHGRVVFVALPEDERSTPLRDELTANGVRDTVRSRLFAGGMEAPWHMFQQPSDVGLAPLLTPAEFLGLQRGLADDLLEPASRAGEVLVDWTPEHADPRSVASICALYPDATVVVDEPVATALPPGLRSRVRVYDGAVDWVATAVGRSRTAVSDARPSTPVLARDRLIVILGCGRSGTTWLQQLWLTHDGVAGLAGNETWLFHQLRMLWQAFEQTAGFGAWVDRETFVAALRRYCDGVFGHVRDRFGSGSSGYVVEKTPVHVQHVARIAAVYPDAWVIHLVRDGRQVARSIAQVPFFDVPDVGDAAAVWQRAVTAVRADQHLVPRFRDLRYEDLVGQPATTMRELWSWVGLEPLPTDHRAFEAAVRTPVSTHRGTRNDAARNEPAASDRAKIYRRAGRTLVREGYASRRSVWRARLTRAGGS